MDKKINENPHEIRFTQITGDTRDTLAGMSSAITDRVFGETKDELPFQQSKDQNRDLQDSKQCFSSSHDTDSVLESARGEIRESELGGSEGLNLQFNRQVKSINQSYVYGLSTAGLSASNSKAAVGPKPSRGIIEPPVYPPQTKKQHKNLAAPAKSIYTPQSFKPELVQLNQISLNYRNSVFGIQSAIKEALAINIQKSQDKEGKLKKDNEDRVD